MYQHNAFSKKHDDAQDAHRGSLNFRIVAPAWNGAGRATTFNP
jgi:hypothetical protein